VGEIALLTLFVAGLLGSTHCLIMCGGLATALGAGPGQRDARVSVLYQVGRVLSYSTAGAIAGALGAGGARLLSVHAGDYLRIGTAAIVVLIGARLALGASVEISWMRWPERLGTHLWRALAPLTRARLPVSGLRPLLMGMLWGWLPCGLVYSALVAAAVSGGFAQGALSMLAFGLGTVPAMLGMGFLGAKLPRPNGPSARLLGAGIVACGLWTAAMPISALAGHAPLHQSASWWSLPALECQPRAQ
jgi:hypothetical protein